MDKALVIVESPAKAKTINRYLGPEYTVMASMGHIRDLPKSKLGVDVENDFEPQYVVIPERKKIVTELQEAAGKASRIILAADPDREGEAICWHLAALFEGLDKDISRVMLHEITKTGIEQAIGHMGKLDRNMFDAQQARRILDRLVGYKISPLLWKKVSRGLSAGRVQSIALRRDLRPRERDQGLRPRGILDDFRPARGLEAAALPGRADQDRRQEGQDRRRRRRPRRSWPTSRTPRSSWPRSRSGRRSAPRRRLTSPAPSSRTPTSGSTIRSSGRCPSPRSSMRACPSAKRARWG